MGVEAFRINHIALALDTIDWMMQRTSNIQKKIASNDSVVLSAAMTSPLQLQTGSPNIPHSQCPEAYSVNQPLIRSSIANYSIQQLKQYLTLKTVGKLVALKSVSGCILKHSLGQRTKCQLLSSSGCYNLYMLSNIYISLC